MPNAIIIHLQEKRAKRIKREKEMQREEKQRTKVPD